MKNKILYIVSTCLLFFAMSCGKDLLNKLPPHSLVEDNAIVDQASAEAALVGVFVPFKNLNPSPFGANYISDGSQMVGFTSGRFRGFDEELELNGFSTGDAWPECSQIINSANAVISKVGHVDNSKFAGNRKKEIIAEARFLRFFAQYYILKYYGQFWDLSSEYGALMRREPASVSTNNYGRSTVADTYTMLFEDLDDAIANGPDFNSVYLPSKLLAKAYKAELLLMRGTDADLQNAITLADEVLNDPKRTMESTYSDIFSNGYNSSELLFTRFMDDQMLSSVFANVGSIVRMFGGIFEPTPSLMNILGDDVRAPFYSRTDTVNNAPVIRVPKLYKDDGNCLPYFMRTSEMVLIKAEAYARLNKKDNAINAMNVLRVRAGNSPLVSSAIQDNQLSTVVFDEITKELALENGYEWFASIRLKGQNGKQIIFTIKPGITSANQFIWPIPQKEIELNTLMVQNPGY